MLKVPKNPFEAETLRDKLVKRGKFTEFKKTYSKKYPVIKNLNTPTLWDSLNNRNHVGWNESPMTAHKLQIISSLIPNTKLEVLNVGCGGGDLENIVFKKEKKFQLGWNGVDISPKSIMSCKKEFPNGHFSVGDILNLKFKKEHFDYVVLMEIMEHISPTKTFNALREVNRVLKKGGKLIISVPMNEGLKEMMLKGENPNAHVRIYSQNIIRKELELSGFKIEKKYELTAFSKMYTLKTFLVKYLFKDYRKPNNLVLLSQKLT